MTDEGVADISDEVLQQLVIDDLTTLDHKRRKTAPKEAVDSDVEEDEPMEDVANEAIDLSNAAGCISFLFTRVSGGIEPSAVADC